MLYMAAGGSGGLVDHPLTHDAVKMSPGYDSADQPYSEGNNANQYTTLQYSVQYTVI